jgi:hypothetical protein
MELKFYDDCFYVKLKKYGLWDSYNKEGVPLISSLTEECCINATRFYLKGLQEGFGEVKTHQGSVDGKL